MDPSNTTLIIFIYVIKDGSTIQWYSSITCIVISSKLRYTFILCFYHKMLPGLINNDFKCILGIWLLLETGHEEMTQVPICIICQTVQSTRELTFKKGKLLEYKMLHRFHSCAVRLWLC